MPNLTAVRNALHSEPTDAAVEKIWTQMQSRASSKSVSAPVPMWKPILAAGLAAALLTALAMIVGQTENLVTEPLTLKNSTTLPGTISSPSPKQLTLSDGSRLSMAQDSRIEFMKNTNRSVEIALREGNVQFTIPKKQKRTWKINCDFVEVEVVGTIFKIKKNNGAVDVSVQRGVVLVRGANVPGGVQRLEVSDTLHVQKNIPPQAPPQADTGNAPLPNNIASMLEEITALPAAPSNSADDGLNGTKDSQQQYNSLSVDDLFLLADTARLDQQPAAAIIPLQWVVAKYPSNPRAPLAAFTVAKMYQDTLYIPTRAGEYFEKALALGLHEPLQETALARMAEAYCASRNPKYQRAAQKYLFVYPQGRYMHLIKHLLKERW